MNGTGFKRYRSESLKFTRDQALFQPHSVLYSGSPCSH